MTFGERLRIAIEQNEMSVADYSRRTEISLQNLSHLMSGQRTPRLWTLQTLVEALPATNLRWLITGKLK